MKILYSGIYCEDRVAEKIQHGNGGIYPFAQQKLEKLILNGIKKNKKNECITVLSTRPVVRYPKYKKVLVRKSCATEEMINIRYLSFINLPILKQLTVFISMLKNILNWCKENKKDKKTVIIYGTNPLNIIPFILLRKIKKYKIVSIVSEIDKLRLFENGSFLLKLKKHIYIWLSNTVQDSLDGYILLCKNMNELINKRKKPYIVMEGMIEENFSYNTDYTKKNDVIMYAGTLNKKYGISKLVDAFDKIGKSNYKLVIYGNGDYKEELLKKCAKNSNIIYLGVASNKEIVEKEKTAKILVNPRPSNETLTRYSFPSKTLEYFSTGSVALITKLEGIPNEYFEHCYVFEEENIDGLKKAIINITEKSNKELEEKAMGAVKFVAENKNNKIQTKKILDFIDLI